MRRALLILVSAVVAVLALPGASWAQAQDSVTGNGTASVCGEVEVDATSGPNGENPSGFVTCGPLFSGPVSCLAVSGNVALLHVQDARFGTVAVRITDNGATGDTFEAFPVIGCPVAAGSYTNFPFSGNLVVVDAPRLPTSKDQCKNGGWRSFGVFRNQGDCVSFVATGGRNTPSG